MKLNEFAALFGVDIPDIQGQVQQQQADIKKGLDEAKIYAATYGGVSLFLQAATAAATIAVASAAWKIARKKRKKAGV